MGSSEAPAPASSEAPVLSSLVALVPSSSAAPMPSSSEAPAPASSRAPVSAIPPLPQSGGDVFAAVALENWIGYSDQLRYLGVAGSVAMMVRNASFS